MIPLFNKRFDDKRFSFKSEELTFDRFYSYFDSVVQAELSSSHPQKQNNRGARLGPRSSAKQQENSNGRGKAHAHLTAHVTAHHALEACLTHFQPPIIP